MSTMVKGFKVYRNDRWFAFVPTRDKRKLRKWATEAVASSHMGEWLSKKLPDVNGSLTNAYTYATTIGVYLDFRPAAMDAQKVGTGIGWNAFDK